VSEAADGKRLGRCDPAYTGPCHSGAAAWWHILAEGAADRRSPHARGRRLGHADASITLKVYAHVLREQTAGVADTFARAIADG